MGMTPEKPSNENNLPDKHFKVRIEKNNIDDTFAIRELEHPELEYIATLGWVGESTIRQPAIWVDRPREGEEYYISYEGYANYMDYQITQAHLVVPRNGIVMKMKDNMRYFFNSDDSVTPNQKYSLDSNNTSIIMNNISIYNKAHTKGIMINLRASFDGLINDAEIGGSVNILCSVDSIG